MAKIPHVAIPRAIRQSLDNSSTPDSESQTVAGLSNNRRAKLIKAGDPQAQVSLLFPGDVYTKADIERTERRAEAQFGRMNVAQLLAKEHDLQNWLNWLESRINRDAARIVLSNQLGRTIGPRRLAKYKRFRQQSAIVKLELKVVRNHLWSRSGRKGTYSAVMRDNLDGRSRPAAGTALMRTHLDTPSKVDQDEEEVLQNQSKDAHIRVANNLILRLRAKNRKLSQLALHGKDPTREQVEAAAESARMKNGKISKSRLGRQMGVCHHTAGKWLQKYRLQ
jgi:hypothetical protein